MRLILLADAFPPLRSSAAVQMLDLSRELALRGHDVYIVIATPEIAQPWQLELINGCHLLRIKTLQAKDQNRFFRAFAESIMPLIMWWRWRRGPWSRMKWDGLIWYSPTIFLGLMVLFLRRCAHAPSYLILRDIFPEWAADMNLMQRGLAFRYFKAFAQLQYCQADVIGVQSAGNLAYFEDRSLLKPDSIQVLHNWLANRQLTTCSIQLSETRFAGRKTVVYAGNMGIAQNMNVLIDLAAQMNCISTVGFVFVGRGTEVSRLKQRVVDEHLTNVMFYDEIEPDSIPSLYAQCAIGLLSLDPRHLTHNIPGKFISYMESGLPVLASANSSNDLVTLIREHDVGRVCTNSSVDSLLSLLNEMLSFDTKHEFSTRCRNLHHRFFSVSSAADQITCSLTKVHKN